MLRWARAGFLERWKYIAELICEKDGNTNDTSNANCKKAKTGLAEVESINCRICKWKYLKKWVINTVRQRCLSWFLFCFHQLSLRQTVTSIMSPRVLTYRLVKSTAGSLNIISAGFTSASRAISVVDSWACAISLDAKTFLCPVYFRILCARRRRI